MTAPTPARSGQRPALSPRQRQVLDFIVARIGEHGYPPTIREICQHFGISSTNGVADHLKALTRKGYLTHQECKSRTLRPVADILPQPATAGSAAVATAPARTTPLPAPAVGQGQGRPAAQSDTIASVTRLNPRASRGPKLASVPLLGRVAAGLPILAVEDARPEDDLLVDPSWVAGGGEVFALQVAGDSMVDDGILDGDTVFVRRRNTASAGETVVVLIDNEATLKRYYPEGKRIRLQPANAAMAPIYLSAAQARQVQIVGVLVGVYRRI